MGQGCSRVGTEVSRSFNKFLPVSFFDRFSGGMGKVSDNHEFD